MSGEESLKTPSKYEYRPGESENSNDSEWGLEIVIKSTPKKRRKKVLDEKDREIIQGMEKDMEETLEEKAAKSNLSHATVKSILKHVFSDEHVLALVKKIEGCEDVEGIIPYEPKITRSKAKELQLDSSASPVIQLPWQTPTPAPEVQALLTDDLQEESSGDEYIPNPNEITPKRRKIRSKLKSESEEEDKLNIALRTRSKLSLSQTPLEKIEEQFIPPDVTHDMYEMDCFDDDWSEFLKSFTKPLEEVVKNTEDEEQDPEYNVLSDEEINTVDKEELRADKAVKVPKKELNELMAELFEYVDIYSKKCEDSQENSDENAVDCTIEIIDGALDDVENHSRVDVDENSPEFLAKSLQNAFSEPQRLLFEQQMRQHVQMLTQTFILTYEHPVYRRFSVQMKEYLLNLKLLSGDKENSKFGCLNLKPAIELVGNWEQMFENGDEKALDTVEHFKKVMKNSVESFKKNDHNYYLPFPSLILETISESDVFIYPFLLPKIPFKHPDLLSDCTPFSNSEYQLVALGLEQFIPHYSFDKEYITHTKQINIKKLCYVLSSVVMPGRTPKQIYRQASDKKREKYLPNPIAYYYVHGKAPLTFHQVHPLDKFGVCPPKERKPEFLPRQWRMFNYPESKKVDYVSEKEKYNPKPALIFSEPKKEESPVKRVLRKIAPKLPESSLEKPEQLPRNLDKKCGIPLYKLRIKFRKCFRVTLTYSKYYSLRKNASNSLDIKQEIDENMLPSMPCLNPSESNSSCKNEEFECCDSFEKDNADEINALMVASTTVKQMKKEPSVIEKKKARKKRDFLANIAMLSPPDPTAAKDQREQFALGYFEKLKETLDEDDFREFKRIFQGIDLRSSAGNAVDLYKKIEPILSPKYPDLADEFLLFLNEEQANAVGKLIPFFLMNHMQKFMKNLEIYFKDQPAQLRKIYRSLYELNGTPNASLDKVKSTLLPLLRGNPLLCDRFLQIFLEESPTSTLLNGAWEILDVGKELAKTDEEAIFESITVSDNEDPSCTCTCHKTEDTQPTKQHCINCGLRFVQGRVYCQTSKGLKPVNISFPFDKDLDHNSRLSVSSSSSSARKKIDLSPSKRQNSPSKDPANNSEDSKLITNEELKSPKQTKLKSKKKLLGKDERKVDRSPKKSKKINVEKAGCNKGQVKRLTEEIDWKNSQSPEYLDVPSSESDDESSQDDVDHEIWTREEDKIILETFQKIYDDEAVKLIAKRLKNRKVEQIAARFEQLMALMEQMARSDLKLT